MKIIAIGRNYADHIAELKNEVPDEPVIFFKPDTAILRNNDPFYYPEYSQDIHHEVELILRISREGKNIDKKFAHKYYDAIGLGIDFTARDLQAKAKAKGLPWTLAKGFNGSAPVSEFVPLEQFEDLQDIKFRLDVNGETKQQGNSKMMLNTFDDIIAYISRFITLKKGDIIFTGTPEGVGPVQIGDRLEGYVEDNKLLDFEIK
ncbi:MULTISPECIES: fumarylacetoacetate hydrolase family protein [Pontibacter]|uniref:2-keto-4-pentenoate hydratase/2-oxohepta-3-ene-1,7-dioic acid hydratase (Catechol pathway) n=1 Tax=Pontibacter lucknowensis TaxID=1077936 RepID=A0A1N6YKF1_9BACT|nr:MULTISPECIES: fumarylacetoacetate hydrolase family protein [Pontibacter]EJF09139.1 fumarylacetoacetate (faa) hydrolase [Pontibacter sp. BAB1700]SIR15057.1 2-keto-4-pentenoate hydratase/2-oxohepta-3-ene-1,7-dioic acid hydratase (catechol pathway) [Pontibacter lucknowensis]